MKEKLLALLKSLGIVKDENLEAVSKELDKLDLEKKPDPVIDPSKVSDPELKKIFEMINGQVSVLTQQNKTLLDTLNAERTEREKAIKIQQDQAKTANEAKVTSLVAQALKEGKIVKAKEEWLKKYATGYITEAEAWVKDAPVDKNFVPEKSEKKEGEKEGEVKIAGTLGKVNQGILKNVMEQASIKN